METWSIFLASSLGLPSLSARYWLFICRSDFLTGITVKPPLSVLLTNGHLLLPGTILATKMNFLFLLSCVAGNRWVTCVFSMESLCLHSLHPGVSPSGSLTLLPWCWSVYFWKMLGTWLYTYFSITDIFLVNGTPWSHAAWIREFLLYSSRPVARIFWRGVMSMSNVYVCVYKQTSRQD